LGLIRCVFEQRFFYGLQRNFGVEVGYCHRGRFLPDPCMPDLDVRASIADGLLAGSQPGRPFTAMAPGLKGAFRVAIQLICLAADDLLPDPINEGERRLASLRGATQ